MSGFEMERARRLTGLGAVALALFGAEARAQRDQVTPEVPQAALFEHPDDTRWWLSGQLNTITQYNPPFPSAYSGQSSFQSHEQAATSYVATLYSGFQVTPTTELIVDLESSAGGGLSDALGIAGFTNLDVVRNPTLSSVPYLARAIVWQVIPLSREWVPVDRGPLELAPRLPARRITLLAGKFGTADFFDVNSVASDSHLQFMNWAVCNTGAYDYAADTRGYTIGAIVEYQEPSWGVRFGEMMMPTVANGIDDEGDIAHARAENLEVELRHRLIPGRTGTVRALGYLNHARMGSYAEANAAFLSGADPAPDITAHRHVGATKWGAGLNIEQELSDAVRMFVRLGWNDGLNESFAYTEIDNTAAAGFDLRGGGWRRSQDKLGLAVVTNGLSAGHREYLALGGLGFILGDGALRYGRENILEAYYTALLFRGISVAGDVQGILNPGYNQDRGPVLVLSARVHLEL